jgi:hypothetical protein
VPRVESCVWQSKDDGDVMAARLVGPALRLLSGQVVCMAASCCLRMTWRFAPSCVSVVTPELCVWAPHTSRSRTCRARRRLVVRGGVLSWLRRRQVPLVGNWSEMQPSGQGLGVLPVRVLTKICMSSLRHSTGRRVLSFLMLRSARVRPCASCLPADRNLHLEGNGFVVLER